MESMLFTKLSEKLERIEEGTNTFAIGTVCMVKQYVVEATGLTGAAYYEKVVIGDGSEGYIDAIRQNSIVIVVTKLNGSIKVGDKVVATGKEFMASFSIDSIGHIVDIFGQDKLVGRKMEQQIDIPVEGRTIGIMERTDVCRPMRTGITGIDMLYPIGRGQRQLIIGDSKTGKTQIGLDTIFNQRGENVTCIYVAIGKTKKEVKEIYYQLLRRGAMEYTIIIAAFNDEPAPVLRNTPYVALSIAEYYLEQKKDVLVIIDDLKRHADVCREIALLMDMTPGRDAYPPDIFYSHSRMLELGCQHMNGGSITILPICETKGGDITDYISTNIISITDGQIVLSQKSFEQGQKPAINYGLSVSRLGGNVQTKEMKKVGPPIRRELLRYLEQKEVFELANTDELSAEMRTRMKRGAAILDMLKQKKFDVKSTREMLDMAAKINNM